MNTEGWLNELFGAIDAKDVSRFAGFLTEDVQFHFGNMTPINGRAAVQAMVDGFFQSIASLQHTVHEQWTQGATVICRGTVTYCRLDGIKVSVPFANITKRTLGQVHDYRIFVDVSPLYAN
jgi:ketosteroid isomerase-like protein